MGATFPNFTTWEFIVDVPETSPSIKQPPPADWIWGDVLYKGDQTWYR